MMASTSTGARSQPGPSRSITRAQSNHNIRTFYDEIYEEDSSDYEDNDEIAIPVINDNDIVERNPLQQADTNKILDDDEVEG